MASNTRESPPPYYDNPDHDNHSNSDCVIQITPDTESAPANENAPLLGGSRAVIQTQTSTPTNVFTKVKVDIFGLYAEVFTEHPNIVGILLLVVVLVAWYLCFGRFVELVRVLKGDGRKYFILKIGAEV